MTILQEIRASVIKGDAAGATAGVHKALEEDIPALTILNEALISGMTEVGEKFEAGEYYIPEMLIAARAMQSALAPLKPLLVQSGAEPLGRVAIGTVQGDLHDVGKNLVGMIFEGTGFSVVDLGVDVKPQTFVEAVSEHQASILGMSALLTTTMPKMAETVMAIQAAGLRDQVKIMVGGVPATPEFAESIRADAYAANATSAVEKAKAILS